MRGQGPMLMEAFIRKPVGMKTRSVVKVEALPDDALVDGVDRLRGRWIQCGECGMPTARAATTRRP